MAAVSGLRSAARLVNAHVGFNDLTDPEQISRGTDYASVIASDVPIVIQHTRLDSRQAENALITTVAHPG